MNVNPQFFSELKKKTPLTILALDNKPEFSVSCFAKAHIQNMYNAHTVVLKIN